MLTVRERDDSSWTTFCTIGLLVPPQSHLESLLTLLLPYLPYNCFCGLMIMLFLKREAAATRKEKTYSERVAPFEPSISVVLSRIFSSASSVAARSGKHCYQGEGIRNRPPQKARITDKPLERYNLWRLFELHKPWRLKTSFCRLEPRNPRPGPPGPPIKKIVRVSSKQS